jgi:hypothetical protein
MALVQVEGTMLTLDKTGCWASSGHTAQGCAALEQALRDCMAVNVRITLSPNSHSSTKALEAED